VCWNSNVVDAHYKFVKNSRKNLQIDSFEKEKKWIERNKKVNEKISQKFSGNNCRSTKWFFAERSNQEACNTGSLRVPEILRACEELAREVVPLPQVWGSPGSPRARRLVRNPAPFVIWIRTFSPLARAPHDPHRTLGRAWEVDSYRAKYFPLNRASLTRLSARTNHFASWLR